MSSPDGPVQAASERWRGGTLCVAILATVILTLGCADGYPSEDVPSVHPAEMNQSQRLAMMNELGSRPHIPQRWTYKLADECKLTIGRGSHSVDVPLKGAEIESSAGEADGTFRVLLVLPDRHPQEAIVALEGAKWFDLVQLRSLLNQVQRSCSAISSRHGGLLKSWLFDVQAFGVRSGMSM